MSARIRLYLDHPLGPGQTVPLTPAQAHYLFGVMRLGVGAQLRVFDGQNGEWLAEVVDAAKRRGAVQLRAPTAPQVAPCDLWLCFAPVRKTRMDFIVEKAVELGVARLQPVITRYCNTDRLRLDKMRAHVVEAAEQCGATHLAEVCAPMRLEPMLAGWDPARRLMFCDEGADATCGASALARLRDAPGGPWAVLVGPEGGFAEEERARLHGLEAALPVRLGPRILRAETAAVAALTLWQAALGDWR